MRSTFGVLLQAFALLAGVALVWLPWMARNSLVHDSFSADGNAGSTLVGRAMRHMRASPSRTRTIQTPPASAPARSCAAVEAGS